MEVDSTLYQIHEAVETAPHSSPENSPVGQSVERIEQ